jgi:gamma-glutamylcysteine synthetase
MKARNLAIALVVVLSIGIFAVAGLVQAADTDAAYQAIVDGAKQMMDGNQKIMAKMAEKGMKDAELTAAEKMMTEGYEMIMKGQAMLATNKAEAQKMASQGGKMMMDAEKKTAAAVEKKGMTKVCYDDFVQCDKGEAKVKEGGLQWFFGY